MTEWHWWLTGIAIPIIIGGVGFWWRVEQRHEQKMDDLRRYGEEAHDSLHKKIDQKVEELRRASYEDCMRCDADLHKKIDDLRKEILDLWKNRKSNQHN